MRREICLWVEWSWSQGLLRAEAPEDEIEAWARSLAHSLARAQPKRFGCFDEATLQIAVQIKRSLRALSYGQRQPSELHPARLDYLQKSFAKICHPPVRHNDMTPQTP
jgi:hypothetical protein